MMYNPAHFAEERSEVLHAFIRQHPLATLVTCGSTGGPCELEASHVPVVLHPEVEPKGVLRCHFARSNPHWKAIQTATHVLLIFQGAQHYISPSWYASKQEHGKVVPTWNYLVVHVRGQAKLFDEQAALLDHLNSLTSEQEASFPRPWSIHDPPEGYVETLSKGIVGIEIAIELIEGKWKTSQNRPLADRHGAAAGLRELNSPASLEMARLVEPPDQA